MPASPQSPPRARVVLGERERLTAIFFGRIAKRFGLWHGGAKHNGAHYVPLSPWLVQGIGCGHCLFFLPAMKGAAPSLASAQPGRCRILAEPSISPQGVCKLWVIPDARLKAPR